MMINLVCKECGNLFLVSEYRKNTAMFCSRKCHDTWRKKNYKVADDKKIIDAGIVKIKCTKCGEYKPESEYSPDRRRRAGHQGACKQCRNEQMVNLRKENPELARQKIREWLNSKPEEYQKDRRNKSYVWFTNKKNTDEAYKEKYRTYRRTYERTKLETSPEYKRLKLERDRIRHERVRSEGTVTRQQWKLVCDFYNNVCLCCGKKKSLTIDHVVPISLGGKSDIENLQPLCGSCNSSKRDKTIDFRPDKGEYCKKIAVMAV